MSDFKQRFSFDHYDVRGCYASLSETCAAIQATHHYPESLAALLNQFAAAAVLLKDSIKIDGSLTIQLRAEAPIGLLMADCFSDGRVRAICEYDREALLPNEIYLNKLEGAVMAVTITPAKGDRYQSIIPVEHAELTACLEQYFAQSEQLPSRFKLMADRNRAVGISLHALPSSGVSKEAPELQFEHLSTLFETVTKEEALNDSAAELITKLFHADNCRLHSSVSVQFGCECSEERSLAAVGSLGEAEVRSLIEENKRENKTSINVDCHFCFQRYELSLESLEALLS